VDSSLDDVLITSPVTPEVVGMEAGRACSRDAFYVLAEDCGLSGLQPDRLLDCLASAALSVNPHVAQSAVSALESFGRRLGAVIATLRDPRTPDEQGDTAARHAFLSYWLKVDSIWLAGGLLSGRCGETIMRVARARAALAKRPCCVEIVPHPAAASLIGAALSANGTDLIAVADLGHTSIRTAIPEHSTDALKRIRPHDSFSAPASGSSQFDIEDIVTESLVKVVRDAAVTNSRPVVLSISVASYVLAGNPINNGRGIYGSLADSAASLRRRVSRESGTDVVLQFIHDGSAAALTAGSANSATITAGTWLGVGFRPSIPPSPLNQAIGHIE
jgi:hypothetical protein